MVETKDLKGLRLRGWVVAFRVFLLHEQLYYQIVRAKNSSSDLMPIRESHEKGLNEYAHRPLHVYPYHPSGYCA